MMATSCRLCGDNNSLQSVFSKQGLDDLIFKYLSIKINEMDSLSSYICDLCCCKLQTFHEFAIQCQSYQDLLKIDSKKLNLDYGDMLINIDGDVKCKEEVDLDYNEDCNDFKDDFCDEDMLPLIESATLIKSKKKSKRKPNSTRESRKSMRKTSALIETSQIYSGEENVIDAVVNRKMKKSSKWRSDDETEMLKEYDSSYIKFKCHKCTEIFENWTDLKSHVKREHRVRAKVMCVCKATLYSMIVINQHLKKHGEEALIYNCDSCDKVFSKKSSYDRHILRHKLDKEIPVGSLKCEKCPKVLSTVKRFQQHMAMHANQGEKYTSICSYCNRVYSTSQSLKHHILAVHEKVKPFICDVCGHAFNQKNNLENHRKVHLERPFLYCDHCPRKFINKRYLARHLQCHAGVTFKCPVCGVLFNYKETLKNHMRIHQNTSKYVCGICNRGFKWSSSLQTHLNIHTGATPYSCPWCPRTFSDRSNCRLHKRKNHPKELAEYERKNGIVHLGKTSQFGKQTVSVVPLPTKHSVCVYPKVNRAVICNEQPTLV